MVNKEKGFALVMALVLLMAMTLMGGSLIVIASSDHRGNNLGDEYQQTFYVAETALYEGEKYLINQMQGPYNPADGKRDPSRRKLPEQSARIYKDHISDEMKNCFYSFTDIDTEFFKLAWGPKPDNAHKDPNDDIYYSKSFYSLLEGQNDGKEIIAKAIEDRKDETVLDHKKFIDKEKIRMKKFKYEYFITRIGSAPFKGYGDSIKKDASDKGNDGMAYRVYGCGNYDNGQIIVPLESTIVLPK